MQSGNQSFGTTPSFGSNPSAFGTSSGFGTNPGFSQSTATPSFGQTPAFGQTSTAPGYGQASTATAFGQPSAAPGFGQLSTTPAFGQSSTTPVFGQSSSIPTFGQTSTAPAFGQATTAPTFGQTSTAPAFGQSSTLPSFGAANSTLGASQPPKFGATTTSIGGFNLSAPLSTTTSSGLTFKASTTSAPSFGSLGTSTSSTPQFGTLTTSTPSTGFTLNSGITASTGFNFGTTSTPATTANTSIINLNQSVGLGGIDTSLNKTGLEKNQKEAETKAKDNQIPNEIMQLIENFKNCVKQQKNASSDIARSSMKSLQQVQENVETLKLSLTEITNELIVNRQLAEKLKLDMAKSLSNAEMAQRTHDTPPGFQFDNNAPLQFFIETVNKFETDMNFIKQQIEEIENHIRSLEHPKILSSEELTLGMRRLHNTFVALAGRLQSLHVQVETQKEKYLNLRKHLLKDMTNVFEISNKPNENLTAVLNSLQKSGGPSPFSTLGNIPYSFLTKPVENSSTSIQAPLSNSNIWGTTPNISQLPSYSASVAGTNSTSLFNTSASLNPNSGFQLQTPPTVGNKRWKH